MFGVSSAYISLAKGGPNWVHQMDELSCQLLSTGNCCLEPSVIWDA